MNKSFSTFINEYRIEKAKVLLQNKSNYSVESVGYESGFGSKSSFFTAFKKLTGKTPLNNAVIAKVKISIRGRIFTDYLLILKYKGAWKIVHKSYSWREVPQE